MPMDILDTKWTSNGRVEKGLREQPMDVHRSEIRCYKDGHSGRLLDIQEMDVHVNDILDVHWISRK